MYFKYVYVYDPFSILCIILIIWPVKVFEAQA